MENITFGFVILTATLAMGVDVCVHDFQKWLQSEKQNVDQCKSPLHEKFRFGYLRGEEFKMHVLLINRDMTANVYLKKSSGDIQFNTYLDDNKKYYKIKHTLTCSNISIEAKLSNTNKFCTTILIAEGRRGDKYNDSCLDTNQCVIVVDLANVQCDVSPQTEQATLHNETGDALQPPNLNESGASSEHQVALLYYTIPSVIVICIIIIVIFLGVKIYYRRKPPAEDAIELNTVPSANEVIYAELALARQDSHPPKQLEESPYAQIIGVLSPVKP